MRCFKCHKNFKPKHIHNHHIFPKYLGGTDKDGRVYLCKKCHDSIHNFIGLLGFKDKLIIKDFTDKWLLQKKEYPYCPICRREDRVMRIAEIHGDYITLACSYCGYQENNAKVFADILQKNINEALKSIKKEERKNECRISKV